MTEIIGYAIENAFLYIGSGWHHLIFLLALLYLIFSRREKENKNLFTGYTFLLFIIYFLPYTAKIIMYYCIGELVYWRMFWLLPIPMVLAYVCTKLCTRFKWFWLQGICMILLICIIGFTGRFLYQPGITPYLKATNPYKLPQDVVDICDQINADWNSTEEVKVIAPQALAGYIRQYDAKIRLLYGRRGSLRKRVKKIHDGIEEGKPQIWRIVRYARRRKFTYFVYETNEQQDAALKKRGFVPIGQCNDYIIYKDGNAA